jgi:hypothetical protein
MQELSGEAALADLEEPRIFGRMSTYTIYRITETIRIMIFWCSP